MDNGNFFYLFCFFHSLESKFLDFILSGPAIVEECSGNFNTAKVRRSLNQLSAYLENLAELSEPSVLAFCSNISSWYRLLSGYPKHRKLVMKVIVFLRK